MFSRMAKFVIRTSLCHYFASPANNRAIEQALTIEIRIYILVSLTFQSVAIKTFTNSDLKHKGEFFEISQTNIANADEAIRLDEVVIKVRSSVNEKADETQQLQQEERSVPIT